MWARIFQMMKMDIFIDERIISRIFVSCIPDVIFYNQKVLKNNILSATC